MPEIDLDNYKQNNQLLPYINGMLSTLQDVFSACDKNNSFYIIEIEKCNSLEEAILKHIDEENYSVQITPLINPIAIGWQKTLYETALIFFNSETIVHTEFVKHLAETTKNKIPTKMEVLAHNFIHLLKMWLSPNVQFSSVSINDYNGRLYANYYHDYLIQNDGNLYYVHFGVTD